MSFKRFNDSALRPRRRSSRGCLILSSLSLLWMILLSSTPLLRAQEFRGTITGVVDDPQGLVIQNAEITVRDSGTGAVSKAKTDSSGNFTVPQLAPGKYEIRVEAAGFQSFVRQGITLEAGDRPAVSIILHPGDVAQEVVVTADASILNTTNAAIGETISTKEVEDLPQNGRTPAVLAQLSIGVASTNHPGQVRPFDNAGAASITIAGTASESTEILLDGSSDTDNLLKLAYSPPPDITQEVTVHAFQVDAGYGHSGGGVLNQITKSGTNMFHGSVYEYNQTAAPNANGYFANRTGTPKQNNHYNQYGLSIGGPVWIPKLFNGRDRVFFLFGWEGIRDSQPSGGFLTVPTDAERHGDFSALLGLGPQYTIYDPTTAKIDSKGVITRSPFQGNIIPGSRLNAFTQKLLSFYPEPNTPAKADGTQNYFTTFPSNDYYDNQFGRLDFNIGQKDKLFLDVRHSQRTQTTRNYFHNISTGSPLDRLNWGAVVDNVYAVNPTTVINVRGNWTRYLNMAEAPTQGLDPTAIDYPGDLVTGATLKQYPSIQFSNCNSGSSPTIACLFTPNNLAASTWTESFHLFGDVTKVLHDHVLKVGVDARQYRVSAIAYNYSTGAYLFGTNFTQQSSTSAAAPFGQDFASFLLGLPTVGDYDKNVFLYTHSNYLSLFAQDDWHVSKTLTLNLGLRFDHDFPLYERHNRGINGFDPSITTPLSNAAAQAYASNPIPQIPANQFKVSGGVAYASDARRQFYDTPSKTFSPRVGFAWRPDFWDGKTVVNGGFSIFVFPLLDIGALNSSGFSASTNYIPTTDNYLTSAADISNPFPNGLLQPTGSSLGASTYQGQSISFFNPQLHNPYSERYAFGIQQQINDDTSFELNYMGAHYVKLLVSKVPLNNIPRQYLSTSPIRDNNVVNLLNASVPNPFKSLLPGTTLNGSTVSRAQLLAPFPQYPVGSSGVVLQDANNGTISYNSLNARLKRRLSHGLSLVVNYTWSRNIEQDSLLNDTDTKYEKRISTYDYPHHLVIASTYTIPFSDRGGNGFTGHLAHTLLGGWAMSGIYLFQSGAPLSWGNVVYLGGPLHLNTRETNKPAFDTTQFDRDPNHQPTYNIRTLHTTDSRWREEITNNLDASLARQFHFLDRYTAEVRGEAFNILNHATFSGPNLTPTSSSFGLITSQANTPRVVQVSAHVRF